MWYIDGLVCFGSLGFAVVIVKLSSASFKVNSKQRYRMLSGEPRFNYKSIHILLSLTNVTVLMDGVPSLGVLPKSISSSKIDTFGRIMLPFIGI
jgi:hypothetical protein